MAPTRRKAGRIAASIDEYLADLGADQCKALNKLRAMIQRAAPKAVECIVYRLPAFRLDGKILVAFGARKNHCAFYPMSSSPVREFKLELAGFETSQGTIRFQPDHPIPATLVRKL